VRICLRVGYNCPPQIEGGWVPPCSSSHYDSAQQQTKKPLALFSLNSAATWVCPSFCPKEEKTSPPRKKLPPYGQAYILWSLERTGFFLVAFNSTCFSGKGYIAL
jgi:hypothetical protein